MTEYTFKVRLSGISKLDCFKEATKDELKVLLAIASVEGASITAENIAKALDVSVARVKAAVALFEECGVLVGNSALPLAKVEYEFEPDEKDIKKTSIETSEAMRDGNLYDMNMDMERIFEKTLALRETERITSLYSEKGLSPAYIVALAEFLKSTKQTLTVEGMYREAARLVDKGITKLEELEVYIKEKSEEIAGEAEMRRLFGIYGRTVTPSERKYFKRWLHEFAFGTVIIKEAYDITVNATSQRSLPYMDSILTEWHSAGCETVEECRARVEIKKHENAKKVKNNSQKSRKTVEAETPKYADFNSEDALMSALERSYGDE